MRKAQPIAWAALGGLAVALLNLSASVQGAGYDLGKLQPLLFAGYALNAVLLLGLGAIVGALNRDERKALRLFQLGAGAPALLGGLLQVASVATPLASPSTSAGPWAPGSVAYAQAYAPPKGVVQSPQLQVYAAPAPWQLFLRGALGARNYRAWYVVIERHADLATARNRAGDICRDLTMRGQGRVIGVYRPYPADPRLAHQYSIAIGPLVGAAEAIQIRDQLVQLHYPAPFEWTPSQAPR